MVLKCPHPPEGRMRENQTNNYAFFASGFLELVAFLAITTFLAGAFFAIVVFFVEDFLATVVLVLVGQAIL